MAPEEARAYFQDMFSKKHYHVVTCVRKSGNNALMEKLSAFLDENEKNREESEAECFINTMEMLAKRKKRLADFLE